MSDKIYILEATQFSTEYSDMLRRYRITTDNAEVLASFCESAVSHYKNGDKVVIVINDSEYVASNCEELGYETLDFVNGDKVATAQYGEPYDGDPAVGYILGTTGVFGTPSATFAIYYEESSGPKPFTPERAGLPDMNVTLNYENPTNNGIALVTKALMWNAIQDMNDPGSGLTDERIAEINDILYNPGYAPMERLVKAFAYHYDSLDPYAIPEKEKANYVLDFANDWERLAFAICPIMFAKPAIDGGALPFDPTPVVPVEQGANDMP